MPPLTLPAPLLRLLWHLERAGYPAYIVGGGLRDALMGRTPHDWDVTTPARPNDMLALFGAAGLRTVPTGLQHGTVTVLIEGMPIECTTYRIEGDYADARHPTSVAFTDRLADDLVRRDFTVNAMAARLPRLGKESDPPAGALTLQTDEWELIDLYGGRADLAAKRLRCVGDPAARFEEDALRILRAVRFCVQLDFALDSATEAALAATRAGLARISVERIASELLRTLACPRPAKGLDVMLRTGLLPYVLPEATMENFLDGQGKIHVYAALDALPCDPLLRLAFLLSEGDAETAASAGRRLKLSNEQTAALRAYVGACGLSCPVTDPDLRRRMAALGRYTQGALTLAAARAADRTPWQDALARAAVLQARGDALTIGELALDGRALMAAYPTLRGRALGDCLAALLQAVLDDPARNTRAALLALAGQWIKK